MLLAKETFDCSWAFEQLQLHRITSIVSRLFKQLSRIRHECDAFSCSLDNECIAVLQTYRLYLWSTNVFQVRLKTRTKILSHRWIRRHDIDRVTRHSELLQWFVDTDAVRVFRTQTRKVVLFTMYVRRDRIGDGSYGLSVHPSQTSALIVDVVSPYLEPHWGKMERICLKHC